MIGDLKFFIVLKIIKVWYICLVFSVYELIIVKEKYGNNELKNLNVIL